MAGSITPTAWLEGENGETFPITGTCSVGRVASNQIVLARDNVSRRHAIVHAQEGAEYSLVDLGSSNGTYLNGRRVAQPTVLRDGDVIQISQFRLTFHAPHGTVKAPVNEDTGRATEVQIKTTPCWLLLTDIQGSTKLNQMLPADEVAVITGRWLAECKQIMEECGGTINKFLGDGFFGYWHDREKTTADVARALEAFKRMQQQAIPPFRLVLHHGKVLMGGVASLGEESLWGTEVNFVFRMEKMAGSLGELRLVSQPARELLEGMVATEEVGLHPLQGFNDTFAFFRY
ncbi:MAG: FHA domain-containing protein [Verrucomicrobia bacterium]|nr:FHA domain-containing protein [Verrucomicrobiota bacterium]